MPTLPPMNVATTGLTCVVEEMNAEIVPRENMPLKPTLRPPVAYISPPLKIFSVTFKSLVRMFPA